MLKKTIALLTCLTMAVMMTACGGSSDSGSANESSAASGEAAAEDGDEAPAAEGDAASAAGEFAPSWDESDTIKIGVAVTLTGTQSGPGKDSERGALIAQEEINAAGGVHGKQVELIVYDDKGKPDEALKVITRLIEQDGVHVVFGPLSSNSTMAVGEYVNDAEIPAVGPAVGVVWLAQGWDYYFRATSNSYWLTEGCFQMMKEDGMTSVAFFNINEEYGNNSVLDMQALVDGDGGIEVLAAETYKDGDTDFTAQCAKIVAADPDCVFMVAWSNDCGQLLKQLRQAGYDKPVYSDNSFTAAPVREIGGDAANNSYLTAAYLLPDSIEDIDSNPAFSGERINHYLHAYVDKYGELPVSDNTYRSYDAIHVIARAISDARSLTGPDIRDALHAVSDYEGVVGVMNYAAFDNGECIDSVNWYKIENGQILPRE